MIVETQALAALIRGLEGSAAIGLDTEGDGLYRYRARLCTIQIARTEAIAILDALALSELGALRTVLGPEGPRKYIHDCAFDVRLLAASGIPVGNVLDTAVAARFIGEPSTGLATLLRKHFGVELAKDLQQADWGARPLGEAELAYLEDDVRHLVPLGELFAARCDELGILEEVKLESEWAASGRDEDVDATPPWLRIKGAGDLRTGVERAVLRGLADVREDIARAHDVPSHRVLPNQLLLTWARRPPRDRDGIMGARMSRSCLLSDPSLRERYADALFSALERGRDEGEVPEAELARFRPPVPPPAERESRRRREIALVSWRQRESDSRAVTPHVVLPGHCLRDLAARGASATDDLLAIPGMGEVRVARYGATLLALVNA